MKKLIISNRNISNSLSFLVIAILPLIVAFKGATRDTTLYYSVFKKIYDYPVFSPSDFYSSSGIEFGFGILCYLFNFISNNFAIFCYFLSFATFYFIKRACEVIKIQFIDCIFFYLPVLFITQQLMQMRQGLASAIVYFSLFLFFFSKAKLKSIAFYCIGCSIHTVSVAFFFIPFIKKYINNRDKFYLYIFVWFFLVFFSCRFSMEYSLLSKINDRVLEYSQIDIFSSTRSFFSLANIRTIILFSFFILRYRFISNNSINLLMYLFVTSMAIRFGFYDFEVLSGRLGIAFGFSEIFLFPMAVRSLFRYNVLYYFVCISYCIISGFITLNFQVPFMIDDYFTQFYYFY